MAIILTCGVCKKRMGSLEPYRIKNDKYLCLKCADANDQEEAIVLFYKNVDIKHLNEFNY